VTSASGPVVSVLALGGTIASTGEGAGVTPTLDAADLLAAVPGLDGAGIAVRPRTLLALPSASLGLAELAGLAAAIRAEAAEGRDGVVVTQGTDTIEETAYYLDRVLGPGFPVVVTGAMRNPTLAGADGPANLLAAVRVAASGATGPLGTVVVFNDEIHAARWVRKTHTSSTAAFVSPDAGPVGRVDEGRVRVHALLPVGPLVMPADPPRPAEVAVLASWLGDDGELVRLAGGHYDGVVVAGLGGGHVPAAAVAPLAELAARMPVVLASRTGAGPVLHGTYDFPGSELDLLGRGLVGAGCRDAFKARILLHLLLASGADRDRIAEVFAAEG
jgi:L-asparaginase